MVRVGHFGGRGSFSECAARKLLSPLVEAEAFDGRGYRSFEDLFRAVAESAVDLGIVLVETSADGSVHSSLDLFLQFGAVQILAEVDLPTEHCLLVLPGVQREEVTKVTSHESVLRECEAYLNSWGVRRESRIDSASAAKEIVDGQLRTTAVVGSALCAEIFGLEILDRHLRGAKAASTSSRSLLIARDAPKVTYPPAVPFKTSIVFKLPRADDALVKSMAVFSQRDISLTRVESRPVPARYLEQMLEQDAINPGPGAVEKQKYSHLLYVDALEGEASVRMQRALKHLRQLSSFVRVLGSYPTSGADHAELCEAMIALSSQGPTVSEPASDQLKIGIVGFGNFGQFLAKEFAKTHQVFGTNLTPCPEDAAKLGCGWVDWERKEDLMLVHNVDVLLLATSITSIREVIGQLPREALLKTNPLIVDVCSVKVYPKQVMLELLPDECDIVCTHPMFGPGSAKHGWFGLRVVYDIVRARNWQRARRFIKIFEELRCRMVCMSCEEHDELAASSQFLTHFMGRSLTKAGCGAASTEIDLKSYKSLSWIVDFTCKNSFDLFYGLYKYNEASADTMAKLKWAVSELEEDLRNRRDKSSLVNGGLTVSSKAQALVEASAFDIDAAVRELQDRDVAVTCLSDKRPDYAVPEEVIRGVTSGDATEQDSLELRGLLCARLQEAKGISYEPQEICVCSSGEQALLMALKAICQDGDHVLVPTPCSASYYDHLKACGAVSMLLPQAADGALWDPQALESAVVAAGHRCRAILLPWPCGAAGTVPSAALLESLAEVLRKPALAHVAVLADHTYELGQQSSFASLDGMRERTILVGNLAETLPLDGLSIGYIAASTHVAEAAAKLHDVACGPVPGMALHAAAAALAVPADWTVSLGEELAKKREFVVGKLREMCGVKCSTPGAGFFVLADLSAMLGAKDTSEGFCKALLGKHSVAVLPGSAVSAPQSVRINVARPTQELETAMHSFAECLACQAQERRELATHGGA